jgi:hypothetical protein
LTDIVVATSADDHFRKAFARVAIVGLGPEPKPAPTVEVYPHRTYLYYPSGYNNDYIDGCNKMQLFRAMVCHADSALVEWSISGVSVHTGPEYLFTSGGWPSAVRIDATVPATTPPVADWATVTLLNYTWPGIVTDLAPA